MKKTFFTFLALLMATVVFIQLCSNESGESEGLEIGAGRGNFIYSDYAPLADKPIRVFTYRPEGNVKKMPIMFVMHGVQRNADEYRDNWVQISDQYGVLIIVPEFSENHFPGSSNYNLGGMFDSNENQVDERYWAYSIIEPIFDRVVKMTGSEQTQYDIFGHSAGAQFTHRFFIFKNNLRTNRVVTANAGWYTMPDLDKDFPYGLKKTGMDMTSLKQRLQSHLLIQLGEEDNDPNHKYLRKTTEAMEQGAHRFERGNSFHATAQTIAHNQSVSFQWSIRTVQGVGHENDKMAQDIARYLYGQ